MPLDRFLFFESAGPGAGPDRPPVSPVRRPPARALGRLPALYRTAYVLSELEGMSEAETAAALRLSVPAVRGRLSRARVLLSRALVTSEPAREGRDC